MNIILNTRLVYFLLFLFSLVVFLIHYAYSGQAVYGDGIGYYAHLRSWVIDGDWNYTNEYKHIYNAENNNEHAPLSTDQVQIVATTNDGRAENHYSPGVAVLLLPFYLVAHMISLVGDLLGFSLPLNGYANLYQILTGIGAISYTVFSIWLLEQCLYQETEERVVSRVAALTIFLSTQLLYYGSFDVINSHFASFFLMVLFWYIYIKQVSWENLFLLGLVAGLLTVNRIQDSAIAVLWVGLQVRNYFFSNLVLLFKRIGVFSIGFILSLWPLLYHWQLTFPNVWNHTYLRNLEKDITSSVNIFGSLFHPVTGLFTKSPILFALSMYLIWLVLNKKQIPARILFFFFIIQIIIITIQGGWYAAAYGGRMYISSLVFFAILLAQLNKILKKRSKITVYVVSCFFVLVNFASIIFFLTLQK